MLLHLFQYSFHTSLSLNNNLTSVYNLQFFSLPRFSSICFSSHLHSSLSPQTLLAANILKVPLGLTASNPLYHLPTLFFLSSKKKKSSGKSWNLFWNVLLKTPNVSAPQTCADLKKKTQKNEKIAVNGQHKVLLVAFDVKYLFCHH